MERGEAGRGGELTFVVEGQEDHDNARPLGDGERVEEEEGGEEEGHELAGGHDCGVNQSPKVLNGVVDDHLAEGGAEGKQDGIAEHRGVLHRERKGGEEGPIDEEGYGMRRDPVMREKERDGAGEREQTSNGEDGGGAVDVEHLVVGGHGVSLEEFLLESGGEPVGHEIRGEEQQPKGGVVLRPLVIRDILGKRRERKRGERERERDEEGGQGQGQGQGQGWDGYPGNEEESAAEHDGESDDVVAPGVSLLVEE